MSARACAISRCAAAAALDATLMAKQVSGLHGAPPSLRARIRGDAVQKRECTGSRLSLTSTRDSSRADDGENRSRLTYYIHTEPLTWVEGRLFCEQHGGKLAAVRSGVENERILAAAREAAIDAGIWLGGSDSVEEGAWRWGDGEQFTSTSSPCGGAYTNWRFGEPNDYPNWKEGEDCAQLSPRDSGRWNDVPCNWRAPSVCAGGHDYPVSHGVPALSRDSGALRMAFWTREGTSVLTARAIAQIAAVEWALSTILRDVCLVPSDGAREAASRRCPPMHSITSLFTVRESPGEPPSVPQVPTRGRVGGVPSAGGGGGQGQSAPPSGGRGGGEQGTVGLAHVPPPLLCDPDELGEDAADACVRARIHSVSRVAKAVAAIYPRHLVAIYKLAMGLQRSPNAPRVAALAAQLASTPGLDGAWLRDRLSRGDLWSASAFLACSGCGLRTASQALRLKGAVRAVRDDLDADARAALGELEVALAEGQAEWMRGRTADERPFEAMLLQDLLDEPKRKARLHTLASAARALDPRGHDDGGRAWEAANATLSQLQRVGGAPDTPGTHGTPGTPGTPGAPDASDAVAPRGEAFSALQVVGDLPLLLPPNLLWTLSSDFNGTYALAVRSTLRLGTPLPGYELAGGKQQRAEQEEALRVRLEQFGAQLRAAMAQAGGPLDAAWDADGGFISWLAFRTLENDLKLAIGSLVLALVCICLHTQSLFLGVCGAMQIALSFPLALWVYREALGIQLFGVLHVIGVFVVLGIGCDDLFVFHDAWLQARWLAPSAEMTTVDGRLWWAFRRASRAILFTSLTDVGAFLSSTLCVIPNLMSFAIFTSILVVANLCLVTTLWPCALLLHERWFACRSHCSGCQGMSARAYSHELSGRAAAVMTTSTTSRDHTTVATAAAPLPPPTPSPPATTQSTQPPTTQSLDTHHPACDDRPPSPTGSVASVASVASMASVASLGSEVATVAATAAPVAERDGNDGGGPHRHARPRALERWYSEGLVPWISQPRVSMALVVSLGATSALLGVRILRIPAPTRDVELWPASHNVYKWETLRDSSFNTIRQQLIVYWGIAGIDREGTDLWDEADLGTMRYDPEFDAADPAAQLALARACRELNAMSERLKIVAARTRCLFADLESWATAPQRNLSFPMPRQLFEEMLPAFLHQAPHMLPLLAFAEGDPHAAGHGEAHDTSTPGTPATAGAHAGEVAESWRLRYVAAAFDLDLMDHAPAHERRLLYDAWQEEVRRLNEAAPPSARGAAQTAGLLWVTMAVQEVLVSTALSVVACSVIVGGLFIFTATRSVRLAALTTLTIVAVLATWLGLAELLGLLGQGMGPIESLIIMVSVGLMLDPLAHVAFAYSEARGTASERLRAALTTIGNSVLAGAISTAGSCSLMFFTTIVLFTQFSALFCSLLTVALLYANLFLPPLLLLVGPPSGERTRGSSCSDAALQRLRYFRWTASLRSTHALHETDAARFQVGAAPGSVELGDGPGAGRGLDSGGVS